MDVAIGRAYFRKWSDESLTALREAARERGSLSHRMRRRCAALSALSAFAVAGARAVRVSHRSGPAPPRSRSAATSRRRSSARSRTTSSAGRTRATSSWPSPETTRSTRCRATTRSAAASRTDGISGGDGDDTMLSRRRGAPRRNRRQWRRSDRRSTCTGLSDFLTGGSGDDLSLAEPTDNDDPRMAAPDDDFLEAAMEATTATAVAAPISRARCETVSGIP